LSYGQRGIIAAIGEKLEDGLLKLHLDPIVELDHEDSIPHLADDDTKCRRVLTTESSLKRVGRDVFKKAGVDMHGRTWAQP